MLKKFENNIFSSKSTAYLLLICAWLLFFSCGKKSESSTEKTPILLSYAQGFEIFQGKDFWEIQVTQGYNGADKTFRYLVLEENSEAEKTGFDAVVQLPVSKIVVTSTTHIPHLDLLNSTEKLIGFPQTNLISSENTRKLIDTGKVTDLGNGPSANPEMVIDLQPDWMMISTL
ncbi:MAG: iron ABC transporter substrate-binding protein, partial [Cyclobacterium sp.]|nr:iron ABC transporter substrate-binding protein [Cyclobacterium sp.]